MFQLGIILRKLERVAEKTSSLKSTGVGTLSKGVQTDFPVSLLGKSIIIFKLQLHIAKTTIPKVVI